MMPASIPIPMPGGLSIDLPRFVRVRQRFSSDHIDDVDARVAEQFSALAPTDLSGKRVAIGVGSRGIRPQPPVVRAVVRELKNAGAQPLVVPAMGSHGGGVAEGQLSILNGYGITEAFLGCPIEASMDVVEVGQLEDGTPIYCDRIASEADYIVPCNRVKPHTDYRGVHESGLVKMMAIGLAKHAGAEVIHSHGFARFSDVIPAAGQVFLENTKTLFGVAMVENAYDQLMHVELVPRERIMERDAALLELAKQNIPQLHFDAIDILVIDEIGKDISGAGMDPNATGRPGTRLPGFDSAPDIQRIVVRDLTEATHGNATGLCAADVTTQRVIRKMDWSMTYVNIVTSGTVDFGKIPIVADNDRTALGVALRGCPKVCDAEAKIVRARNTLELSEIWASEAMLPEIETSSQLEALGDPVAFSFDADGNLPAFG
ncbi:MAG: DUF2088 domain-containing protein [Chromatiales bacterium]|jgi:hypothetical protein|nr:DUF2088 domain-containing protein [Chromatiales bacterium]